MKRIYFPFLLLLITACSQQKNPKPIEGPYQFNVVFEEEQANFYLPFDVLIDKKKNITIKNGKEEIAIKEVSWKGDSLIFQMPVFMTEFRLQFEEKNFKGVWIKKDREEPVSYPVFSRKATPRFFTTNNGFNIEGKWKATFSYPDGESYPAIGEFQQKENMVTGTFFTETGDYRFLEGVVSGDSIKLSAFDGSHAFLFLGKKDEEVVEGIFKASHTHVEYFKLEKDHSFRLANADTLTYLKPGFNSIIFTLPELEGDSLKYPSARFENKVVIVQLMGSWCSNCMDETAFLTELHNQYQNKGLEVIAVGFERFKDIQKSMDAMARVKSHFNSNYAFALGGISSKETAAQVFPMLNKVMSFPTAIFIDKNGKVRKIHTGFSGPGTSAYEEYVISTTALVETLLSEL